MSKANVVFELNEFKVIYAQIMLLITFLYIQYPLQHKAFQEKRNQNRRDKLARLTNEERQQYYKDTYAHKKKNKKAL